MTNWKPQRGLALALLVVALAATSLWLLGQEDGAERDAWQRPQEVMDALGINAGSVVADVGSGSGYFTFHLAARVTSTGRVYAVDIEEGELKSLRRRAEREHLTQIETILGQSDDPKLPPDSLDAILVINAYHEMREYDAMLGGLHRALKPGGRLAIIDSDTDEEDSRSRYYSRHRVPDEVVREDAERHGFRFHSQPPGFTRPSGRKEFYFLIFEKPTSADTPAAH